MLSAHQWTQSVTGILGLNLEGPHIAMARKGAHEGRFVRPMDDSDLALLCEAAGRLPLLKVTLAPELVQPTQIAALSEAGALASHSPRIFSMP